MVTYFIAALNYRSRSMIRTSLTHKICRLYIESTRNCLQVMVPIQFTFPSWSHAQNTAQPLVSIQPSFDLYFPSFARCQNSWRWNFVCKTIGLLGFNTRPTSATSSMNIPMRNTHFLAVGAKNKEFSAHLNPPKSIPTPSCSTLPFFSWMAH